MMGSTCVRCGLYLRAPWAKPERTAGYFAASCLDAVRMAVRHIAASGLWVILAAKARYAAGEAWPRVPDVFHDDRLAERCRATPAPRPDSHPDFSPSAILRRPSPKPKPNPNPARTLAPTPTPTA